MYIVLFHIFTSRPTSCNFIYILNVSRYFCKIYAKTSVMITRKLLKIHVMERSWKSWFIENAYSQDNRSESRIHRLIYLYTYVNLRRYLRLIIFDLFAQTQKDPCIGVSTRSIRLWIFLPLNSLYTCTQSCVPCAIEKYTLLNLIWYPYFYVYLSYIKCHLYTHIHTHYIRCFFSIIFTFFICNKNYWRIKRKMNVFYEIFISLFLNRAYVIWLNCVCYYVIPTLLYKISHTYIFFKFLYCRIK